MLTRRQTLLTALALPGVAAGLTGCGPNQPAKDSASQMLRAVWWGNATRTKRTNEALQKFAR